MIYETLPGWFWIIYYLVIFVTFCAAFWATIRNRLRKYSVVTMILAIFVPIGSAIFSLGRVDGQHEFEHIFNHLIQGSVWSILLTIGYVYLAFWWVFNVYQLKKKS